MPVVSKGEFTVSRLDDGVSSYLHTAWKMADGTFSSEYPQENLLSDTLPNKWPTLENKRAVGSSISKINDAGNILVTATGGTPYYFAGNYSATQVLSDDFLNRIRGKRLVASANVTFVNQLTVPTDSLGISIYCWDDTGRAWQPENRKSMAGSEIISIDVLIPENIVNILVAVRGYGSFVSGASYEIKKMKLEIVEQGSTPTIYTPAPSEDYTLAYPKWRGEYTDFTAADSTNPDDYTWTAYLGEQGPPTGIVAQDTVPDGPYVGMLWQCTGNIAGYINPATYRWNGSAWEIYQFTAHNIMADTFTGFTFQGVKMIASEFISHQEFDRVLQPAPESIIEKHVTDISISDGRLLIETNVDTIHDFSAGVKWTDQVRMETTVDDTLGFIIDGIRRWGQDGTTTYSALVQNSEFIALLPNSRDAMSEKDMVTNNNWRNVVATKHCGKQLWEGGQYMTSNQIVTPMAKLSDCLNGWLLRWQRYNPGVGLDSSRYFYQPISKLHPSGKGITTYISAPASDTNNGGVPAATKYVYVTDTTITGYDANSVSPGNNWALSGVFGW